MFFKAVPESYMAFIARYAAPFPFQRPLKLMLKGGHIVQSTRNPFAPRLFVFNDLSEKQFPDRLGD